MTVSSELNRASYAGNGTAGPFSFSFYVLSSAELEVYVVDALGVQTLKTITTHYTLSGGIADGSFPTGGNVTFTAGNFPAAGETIVLIRNPSFLQSVAYTTNDPFPADTHERGLDRLSMASLWLKEQIARSLVLGAADTDGSGAYEANGNKIEDLGDPTAAQDAVTKTFGDANYGGVAADAAAASAVAAAASETAAAASETAAAADAVSTAADAVSTAADVVSIDGIAGAWGLKWTFSSTTAMADPGAGTVRFNHATVASVTAMAFDVTSADAGNPNVQAFLEAWDDAINAAARGTIVVRKVGAPATYAIFSVNAVVDQTGWLQMTVAYVDGNGTFSNADTLHIGFSRSGADGVFGAIASQAEAEAGTDNIKGMSALRTAQAIAALAAGGVTAEQVFTAGGTYTPHVDATKALIIVTGAGGAGGDGVTGQNGGTSGGAGGTAIKLVDIAADIGASKAVTVGAGGTTEAASGGASDVNTTTPIQGNGGTGHVTNGGAGGTATGGTINIPGGSGTGEDSARTVGNDPGGRAGALGGGSFWGGGGGGGKGGPGSSQDAVGKAATAYGGGGGGGGVDENSSKDHGDGADGVVYILEF